MDKSVDNVKNSMIDKHFSEGDNSGAYSLIAEYPTERLLITAMEDKGSRVEGDKAALTILET